MDFNVNLSCRTCNRVKQDAGPENTASCKYRDRVFCKNSEDMPCRHWRPRAGVSIDALNIER